MVWYEAPELATESMRVGVGGDDMGYERAKKGTPTKPPVWALEPLVASILMASMVGGDGKASIVIETIATLQNKNAPGAWHLSEGEVGWWQSST